MKQIFLFLAAAAVFIIAVGLLSHKLNKPFQTTPKTILLGDTKVNVEIANTDALRRQGLSGRGSLDANSGMLFVFNRKPTVPSFWMKGMLFALDIIWIKDSKVFQINKNVQPPPPETPDAVLKLIVPKGPIEYVLEVKAGFSDKNGIILNTPVDLSGI